MFYPSLVLLLHTFPSRPNDSLHQLLLTKGDNNPTDDIDLYRGVSWLERRHIVGKVRGCVCLIYYPTDLISLSQILAIRGIHDNSDGVYHSHISGSAIDLA
jgi:hypothetical protein